METGISNHPSRTSPNLNVSNAKSSMIHELHSHKNKECSQKQFVCFKWIFANHEEALQKLDQLERKMGQKQNQIFAITSFEIIHNQKLHEIKGKVKFSLPNFSREVQEASLSFNSYSEQEIWDFAFRLCELFTYLSCKGQQNMKNISGLIQIDNKIIVEGIQRLPTQILDYESHVLSIIARIITNLALLTTSKQDVSLVQINRVNLKYNANLATFIYSLQQKRTPLSQIFILCKSLKQKYSVQIEKRSQSLKPQSKNILHKSKMRGMKPSFVSQSSICDEKTINTAKNNITNGRQTEQIENKSSLKRLQQIKPRQLNGTLKVDASRQNKENKIRYSNKLDIDNHSFPKINNFKKCTMQLNDGKCHNQNKSEQAKFRNNAQMKMASDQKLDIFAQCDHDSLLESILGSQQSAIVRNSESLTLNLDQDLESMANDFLKDQQTINDQPKEEASSILQFAYLRNSTIIELTEENEESGSNSKDNLRQLLIN